MKRIFTHTKPDADAIAVVRPVQTYLFPGENVEVAFDPRPRSSLPGVDYLGGLGGIDDPARRTFNHKPPAVTDRNATYDAQLVWEHLLSLARPCCSSHPSCGS